LHPTLRKRVAEAVVADFTVAADVILLAAAVVGMVARMAAAVGPAVVVGRGVVAVGTAVIGAAVDGMAADGALLRQAPLWAQLR
jgi:hypothetical protein